MNIAIVGYGNLGRSIEHCLCDHPDANLVSILSRRTETPTETPRGNRLLPIGALEEVSRSADCLLLALSSDSDLPSLGPKCASLCSTVDAFDTHAKFSAYRENMDRAANGSGNTSLIGIGWDPGLFSVARVYASSLHRKARMMTLYGEGVSQGHSAAARHIPGVLDARSYTLPTHKAAVLSSIGVTLPEKERHRRRVFVLAQEGADQKEIEAKIRSIPDYFAGEETEVIFDSREDFEKRRSDLSHRGEVTASFTSGTFRENRSQMRLSLTLDSNPDFTAEVMIAAARATVRLKKEGKTGAYSLVDLPPVYLLPPDGKPMI